MDFFASQEFARRKTRQMVVLLLLSVAATIAGVYAVVAAALIAANDTRMVAEAEPGLAPAVWLRLDLLAAVALVVSAIVFLGSLFKIVQLRGGGGAVVAESLGGRRLNLNTADADERRLLNVVEEMAIASGTPVPPVYVLEGEAGINAFAAGYTPDDAVIGVNRGTIATLTRDELQGVIAHEFSHILNGDMRMSIRIIGILHGIQLIALIGYFLIRIQSGPHTGRRDDSKGRGFVVLVGIGLLIVGSIGLFFARLIKASVSRQREYLADASAVQFTRNPEGIASALKVIGALAAGSRVAAANAESASHLFFGDMRGRRFSGLLATHPPLVQRIQKVDPQFDGDFAEFARHRAKRTAAAEPSEEKSRGRRPRFPGRLWGLPGAADRFPLDPALVVAGIGLPSEDDLAYSTVVAGRIPPGIDEAIREPFSARCVALALLLADDEPARSQQLAVIRQFGEEAAAGETLRLREALREVTPSLRLPIVEILQGTLAGLSRPQYRAMRAMLEGMAQVDQQISLFEFFMRHHLVVHLDRKFGERPPPRVRFATVASVGAELGEILVTIARAGHAEAAAARRALQAAVQSLPEGDRASLRLPPLEAPPNWESTSRAVSRLGAAAPSVKKIALAAAAVAVTFDGQVTVHEAELFRAIAESLDCPVPPIVATSAAPQAVG